MVKNIQVAAYNGKRIRYLNSLYYTRFKFLLYFQESGVMPYLHMLGFEVMGYGCSTCMENSCVEPIIPPESLVCCGVLSGNRNFEGRILPEIKANYLASPPLVVAYAMAGRIDIDFNKEPLGKY